MWQAIVILLREGFESFLSVAIILAYLGKTDRRDLRAAVWWGVGIASALSIWLGYVLSQNLSPLLEGILGLVAMVLVAGFVVHVWRTAHRMRRGIETGVARATSNRSSTGAFIAVLVFTALTVTREGMEAAMLLILVRKSPHLLTGAVIGVAGAIGLSWAWVRLQRRINIRRFMQVTALLLLLFALQIGVYAFHELSEAGVLPGSEFLSTLTEPFSPEGMYGKWLSLAMISICGIWLVLMTWRDRRGEISRS